jgi:AhpD family alkylhydroperoxidase
MAHITLPDGLPGIRGPMAFRPETAKPLSELAEVLLRGESTLTPAEREMIAAHVSARNDCFYCHASHAVQQGGKSVTEAHVARARAEGATDREIHDTVLIAAAFCMFNRYVDGLATWTPADPDSYRERAAGIAPNGYAGLPGRLAALVQGRSEARDRPSQT